MRRSGVRIPLAPQDRRTPAGSGGGPSASLGLCVLAEFAPSRRVRTVHGANSARRCELGGVCAGWRWAAEGGQPRPALASLSSSTEIGRASCRERGEIPVGGGRQSKREDGEGREAEA